LVARELRLELTVTAAVSQLYNEEVNDLLSPGSLRLPIHEGRDGVVFVGGLREEVVTSAASTLKFLHAGEDNRHVGATKMNERSSRSHTIFRMVCLQCWHTCVLAARTTVERHGGLAVQLPSWPARVSSRALACLVHAAVPRCCSLNRFANGLHVHIRTGDTGRVDVSR
jgi:hypothetical protein